MKNNVEAQLFVEWKFVTIFFSDIEQFTSFTESNSTIQVATLTTEYFAAMYEIINEHHGIIIDFIGDGIMALWNAPSSVENHPTVVCEVALKMHKKVAELSEKWKQQGFPQLQVRIGIHSSKVLVGNIGSPWRMKFGALGDGVNLTSRLEGLNKHFKTNTIISEDTHHLVKDHIVCRPLGIVVVKGRENKTKIYEAIATQKDATIRFDERICMFVLAQP